MTRRIDQDRLVRIENAVIHLNAAAEWLEKENPAPLILIRDIRRLANECTEEIAYLRKLNDEVPE